MWALPNWLRIAAIGTVLAVAGCASDGPDADGISDPGGSFGEVEMERPHDSGESAGTPATVPGGVEAESDDSQAELGGSEDADPCVDDFGVLSAGQYIARGTVTVDVNCVDTHLGPGPEGDTVAARWHTFTLHRVAWVNVGLETAPDGPGLPTAQISLLEGHGGSGEVVRAGDDDGTAGTAGTARIGDVYLAPGDYTVEVRTVSTLEQDEYALTVTVPLSGLGSSIVTTIDADNIIKFDYWPPHAQIWLSSTESNMQDLTSFLRLGLGAADGEATIALSPGLAGAYLFTLHLTTGYETTSTRDSFSVSYDVAGDYGFGINNSDCGPGMTPSPHSGLCIADSTEPPPPASSVETVPGISPEDGSVEVVEPGPRTRMRSALDAAPFSWSEHLASMRVRDILDVSDLRVMPAAGDLAGPLFSAPDVDRHMAAAIGRVFDLCDDEEAQIASRVDPYGTGRWLPPGMLPVDEFMDLQRDRFFMSCDGSEPDAYIGYRYVLFDAWGQWGGYRTAEDALERYQASRVAVDGRYVNTLPDGRSAWGSLTAGHGIEFAERDAPVDEVRVLLETVAVRDGVLRGLVRNWSRRYFAYGARVSAADGVWHWPLSIQPGEVAPFEIEDWTGTQEPGEIEFVIDTEMSLEVDISRAWHINEHPRSQSVEAAGVDGRGYPPDLSALLPQHGAFLLPSVWAEPVYDRSWYAFGGSSYPSLSRMTDLVRIEDLRGYVALLDDYGGRVMEVQKAWPLVAGWLRDSETGEEMWRHLEANRYPFVLPADDFRKESVSLDLLWYSPDPWAAFVWLGGAHPQTAR